MFENVLGQAAAAQLTDDIKSGTLAPAMLFAGPQASGKGTAALELGRVISCTVTGDEKAPWGCQCSSCARHRLLIHPDILCLGRRAFSAEVAASAGAFLREPESVPSRLLFIRAVRKLLARFNPVLFDDEPKKGKAAIGDMVVSLEEDIDEFTALASQNPDALVKHTERMLKSAYKLESEIPAEIPIDRIRRAAWWGRLAPAGNGKLLLIENADRMNESARNSLLKLLEEPPARLTLVLTTSRPGSLLPTVLSRLRPYRFNARDAATEADVIRRVFRDTREESLSSYLDSFLPVSGETLNSIAAFFAASAAFKAAVLSKKQGRQIAEEVVLLGKYSAPKAEAAGFGRPQGETGAVVTTVLEKAEKFEIRSLFPRFLFCLLEHVSLSQRAEAFLPSVAYNEVWKKSISWGELAVCTYNLTPAIVLEKLFTDLSRGMAEL